MVAVTGKLIRKVDRLSKWRSSSDPEWNGRIPGACLRDFDDTSSCPSIYLVEDDNEILETAVALAINRNQPPQQLRFDAIDLLVFEISSLACDSEIIDDAGLTKIPAVNLRHRSVNRISADDQLKIVSQVHAELFPFDQLGSCLTSGVRTVTKYEIALTAQRLLTEEGLLDLTASEQERLNAAIMLVLPNKELDK